MILVVLVRFAPLQISRVSLVPAIESACN
jgi:hypothetical protein